MSNGDASKIIYLPPTTTDDSLRLSWGKPAETFDFVPIG